MIGAAARPVVLRDYIADGGALMTVLVAILVLCLALILYVATLLGAEAYRAWRFRRKRRGLTRLALEEIPALATPVCLPALYLERLADELGAGELTARERRRAAEEVEEGLVRGIAWPLGVLHFLAEYASKIGLCGTILGLCVHFLDVGTGADGSVASRAMAVALYTTLGGLTIALIAEPSAYVLESIERWVRRDLRAWFRLLERGLARDEPAPAAPSNATIVERAPIAALAAEPSSDAEEAP